MTSLTYDITSYLVSAGYTGVRAYRFDEVSQDEVLVTPGGGTSIGTLGGDDIEFPKFQVQVRDHSNTSDIGETRVLAIKTLLHNNTNVSNCKLIRWTGRVPDYWQDDNRRHIFAIDFTVIARSE